MMDLTDRNNEKYTKQLELFGNQYQVHFYYNKKTKAFYYWGISREGFSPGDSWEKIIENYIVENHEYELRRLAEEEIKTRAGLTPEQRALKGQIIDNGERDGEGVRRFYNGGRVD